MAKAGKAPESWRNRIVTTGSKPANQFLANPQNYRRHPVPQREALRGILSEVGWVTGVIENVTTGHLIDGHARIEEALSRDENEPVPYVQVELSEHEEALVLTALDPLGAMATADKEALDLLLNEVHTGDAALSQMIAELAASSGLIYGESENEKQDTSPQLGAPEYRIIVKCESESQQIELIDRFEAEGLSCSAMIN